MTDFDREEQESFRQWQQKHHQEVVDSYPEDEEGVFCYKCGSLLKYKSMSYYEGYHIDSCE